MRASRPYRWTITPPSTAPTSSVSREPAKRAENNPDNLSLITEPTNEAGRRFYRCPAGGDLGSCVRREADCARRILAGADDDAALCQRRDPLPVRAQARRFLAALDRDQLLAVPRPVPGAGLCHCPWRAGRPVQRDRAEPGAIHHRLCRCALSRIADADADH